MPVTKQISFVKWIEILIYCVVLHSKPNIWVVSLSIIFIKMLFFASLSKIFFYELVWSLKKLCCFTSMTKHLAGSLGRDYFVEVQGTTPMTKHILSISGVQIAPKCFKFISGPNTKYVDHVWVIKKTKHNSSPPYIQS